MIAADPLAAVLGSWGGPDAELEVPTPIPTHKAVCGRCRQDVRRNPDLRISYCRVHGFVPFAFVPMGQKRLPGA